MQIHRAILAADPLGDATTSTRARDGDIHCGKTRRFKPWPDVLEALAFAGEVGGSTPGNDKTTISLTALCFS
jgi:hypothetical protein